MSRRMLIMGEGIFNKFKNWITEEEEDFDGVEEEYEQEDFSCR